MQEAGTYLGLAIGNFLNIFNPSIVILGGGVISSGDLIIDPIRKALPGCVFSGEYLNGLVITTSRLGDEAGLLGTLAMIRNPSLIQGK